jgi:hypothetical protein
MLTVTTDSQGRAAMRGFRPNSVEGKFEIRVNASANGSQGSTVINQVNAIGAGAAASGGGLAAWKWLLIVGAAGAAAGTGIYLGTRDSGNGGTPARPPIVLTPGSPTVGGPR